MIDWGNISLRRGVFWLAVYVVLAIAGLGIFFASGLYNVAASDRHLAISETIIEFVLARSVAAHSDADAVPDLDDDGLAALGARHYAIGCLPCHGSPAQPSNPIVSQMYPAPPPLGDAVEEWRPEELFWIVKHGLKFTGMPAWAGTGRDDEVWSLVAFLERLPEMNEAQFAELAGESLSQRTQGQSLRFADPTDKTIAFCDACHGAGGAPPVSDEVPPLAGQHAAYLQRALSEYRDNRRQSGIMEPIAASLDADVAARLVAHYASQPRSFPRAAPAPDESAQGREIVERGIAGEQIPACIACHSGTRSPHFPVLAGLPADYVKGQLRLFRSGVRDATTYGRIMSVIARRLSDEQIEAAAAYIPTMPAGPTQDGLAATESAP